MPCRKRRRRCGGGRLQCGDRHRPSQGPGPGRSPSQRGLARPDNKSAIADYNEAIKLAPEFVAAYVDRGVAYHDTGQYEHAVRDFLKAVELKPTLAIAWGDLGVTYSSMRDWNHAIEALGKAITLDPADPVNLNNRCYAYNMTKRYDDAMKDCWARVIKGQDAAELRRALDDCNKALELQTNEAAIFDSRALAYLKLGKYDDCIADYDRALDLDPKMATSLFGRGVAKDRREPGAGKQDIADAKRQTLTIADEMARYGVIWTNTAANAPANLPAKRREP